MILAVVMIAASAVLLAPGAARLALDPVVRCSHPSTIFETNPGSQVTARWEWFPPGFVCEYRDDRNRVVTERRL